MTQPVGSLVVRIGSDITGLVQGFKKGDNVVARFGADATKVAKRIALIGSAAAGVGAALATKFTRDGLRSIDALAKFSRVVGISTDALTRLQFAAQETAGFTGDQFNLAFQRMTRRIAEAAEGTGEAKGAIEALGLSARDLAQAGPGEAFLRIADAMQQVDDQGERLRLGFKLFDSEGARLVNTLAAGRGEILRLGRDAAALGLTFSDLDAQQVERANDAVARIGAVFEGVSRTLAIELSPFIEAFANKLTDAAREAGGFGEAITSGIELGLKATSGLADAFREVEIGTLKAKRAFLQGKEAFLRFGNLQDIKRLVASRMAIRDVTEEIEALEEAPPLSEKFDKFIEGAREAAAAARIVTTGEDVGDPLGRLDFGRQREDPELEALREKVATRLEVIRAGLLSEREAEEEAFQEKLTRLREGRDLDLLTEKDFMAQKEALTRDHQDRLTEIEERAAEEREREEERRHQERIRNIASTFDAIGSLAGTLNRTLFENNKAAAIAEAVMNGIAGAIRTWNAYPYPWNIPLTAAHVAGTAAQLAQIQSTSFSQRSASVSAPPAAAAPLPGPGQGGGGGGDGGARPIVNISLVGQTADMNQVRELIHQINDALADGARLRIT